MDSNTNSITFRLTEGYGEPDMIRVICARSASVSSGYSTANRASSSATTSVARSSSASPWAVTCNVDAAPACAVASSTRPASTNDATAACALCTVMRERRASSLNEIPGFPRMCPSSPNLRAVSPSGLRASTNADSQTRLIVSSPTVGLKGGGPGSCYSSSSCAATSSGMSMLVYTSCTSSLSSSASTSLSTLRAPSRSTGTLTDGWKLASAES